MSTRTLCNACGGEVGDDAVHIGYRWLHPACAVEEGHSPAVIAAANGTALVSRFDGRRYDLSGLIRAAGDEPPWRVGGVLMDGHLTVLSGMGGEGKTWGAFGFCGGVAHGATVAGMECKQGRAVIFDAENGPYVLGTRLAQMTPTLPADSVAIYDAEGLRLDSAEDVAWMKGVLEEERANLFVLDSLRALSPAMEENASDSAGPVVIAAKNLARSTKAAGLLLVHRGWDKGRDLRGSTVIRDQADLVFVLERDERDPERRWRRRLRTSKCRVAEEPPSRWLGIRSSKGETYLTEAAAFEATPTGRNVRDELMAELKAVVRQADGALSGAELTRRIGREPPDTTVRRAISDMVETGDLVATGDGYVGGAK